MVFRDVLAFYFDGGKTKKFYKILMQDKGHPYIDCCILVLNFFNLQKIEDKYGQLISIRCFDSKDTLEFVYWLVCQLKVRICVEIENV